MKWRRRIGQSPAQSERRKKANKNKGNGEKDFFNLHKTIIRFLGAVNNRKRIRILGFRIIKHLLLKMAPSRENSLSEPHASMLHAFCTCNYIYLPLSRQHKTSVSVSRFAPLRHFQYKLDYNAEPQDFRRLQEFRLDGHRRFGVCRNFVWTATAVSAFAEISFGRPPPFRRLQEFRMDGHRRFGVCRNFVWTATAVSAFAEISFGRPPPI